MRLLGISVGLAAAIFLAIAHAQTLRFGMNTPPSNAPDYQGALAMKNYAEFNSGGRLKIQIFASGQLGSKMRTMESPVYIALMKSLGAAATPIGTDQLIMSLQQRVVDGEENAASSVNTLGIADVQKFMSTDDHTFSSVMIISSNAAYDSLAPDLQHILVDAATVMGDINNAGRAQSKAQDIESIRKKGVEVHLTTAAEKQQFKQLAQAPVLQYIQQQVGKEAVDALLADEKRAEALVYGQ